MTQANNAVLLRKAVQHHQQGEFHQAEQYYKEAIKAQPDNAEAWHFFGLLAYQVNNYNMALGLVQQAIQVNSKRADFYNTEGLIFSALSQNDNAIACYEKAVALDSSNSDIWYNFGKLLREQKHYNQAIILCKQALQALPHADRLWELLGTILQSEEKNTEALEAYSHALTLNPNNIDTHYNIALLHSSCGETEKAINSLQQALQLNPNYSQAYRLISDLYLSTERYDEAITSLRSAITLEPNDYELHRKLGSILADRKCYNEAEVAFQDAIRLQPDNYALWMGLGAVKMEQGELPEAIGIFQSILLKSPAIEPVLYNLAMAYVLNKQPAQALETFNTALVLVPHSINSLCYKSHCLSELGRTEEAKYLTNIDQLALPLYIDTLLEGSSYTLESLNNALRPIVENHSTIQWERAKTTTRKGYQTGNLLIAPSTPLCVFEKMIRNTVQAYKAALTVDALHPFLQHFPTEYRINLWATLLDEGGHQAPHIHASGWVSGVYYLDVPEEVSTDDTAQAGWLEFGQPGYNLPYSYTPTVKRIKPQVGMFVLFPSYFFHRTLPFQSKKRRISLAFDIIPTSSTTYPKQFKSWDSPASSYAKATKDKSGDTTVSSIAQRAKGDEASKPS